MHKKSVRSLVMILVVLIVYLFTNINVYAANPLSQVKKRTFGEYKVNSGVNHNQTSSNTGYSDKENDPPNANYDLYFDKIIYVFLTIFLYLLKCPQSLILSALRAFCFCGKPHISRSIFLYFRYQAWLKSW